MKTRRSTFQKMSEAMFIAMTTLTLAAGSLFAASTFGLQETYLADGQSLTLTQKLGQAIIQFDPSATQNTTPTAFIAANGTPFVLEVDLTPARGLYTMQTGGTV